MSIELGLLERVDVRRVWENEAGDFTPWLAKEANIAILGDAIGIDLEVEAQEKDVGPFRADILCKDTANGNWVLVENQLEKTDHPHLGQLMTYAAGLKAVTIVWIAARFTDEHRAALDWLNEITSGEFNFFGVEIECWRIGSSPIAPKFNVVSQPNDWAQSVAKGAGGIEAGQLTPAKQLQLEFWTTFREFVLDHDTPIKPTKALAQNWMNISIGRSGFSLVAVASTWSAEAESPELRVELVMNDANAKAYFKSLELQRTQIESDFGGAMQWAESPGKKQSKVFVSRPADLEQRPEWPTYHDWLLKNLERFQGAFAKRVRELTSQILPVAGTSSVRPNASALGTAATASDVAS